jgi:septum formation protein
MLRAHGIEPIVRPADVDESIPLNLNVRQTVMYLALKKALASSGISGLPLEDGGPAPFVIAADTVVFRGRIFGKPASKEEARQTLDALRNGRHTVYTGVAVLRVCPACGPEAGPDGRRGGITVPCAQKRVFCEETHVFFKDYSQSDIETYIASGEPFDKSGGYAVQGGFSIHVDHIEGDVDTVIGFPWRRIEEELRGMVAL